MQNNSKVVVLANIDEKQFGGIKSEGLILTTVNEKKVNGTKIKDHLMVRVDPAAPVGLRLQFKNDIAYAPWTKIAPNINKNTSIALENVLYKLRIDFDSDLIYSNLWKI